jgi:hypothetical protein
MDSQSSIETRAMKFKLQRGRVRCTSRDKDSEELLKQTRGDEGQVVSRKLFLNKNSPVHKYQQKSSEMYQYHVANTLPCGDDGTRLMSNSIYFEYTGRMSQFISELEALKLLIVGDIATYAAIVHQDIDERNKLLTAQGKPATASTHDYSPYEAMCERLYVTWFPEPIATSGDFRFEIPAEMKKAYDDNMQRVIDEAKEDILARVIAPMRTFVAKMTIPIGEDGSVFRDTTVTNLCDLVEQLPKLNIDGDARITAMVESLRGVTSKFVEPNVLRNSQSAREAAKADVSLLLDKLSGGWKI